MRNPFIFTVNPESILPHKAKTYFFITFISSLYADDEPTIAHETRHVKQWLNSMFTNGLLIVFSCMIAYFIKGHEKFIIEMQSIKPQFWILVIFAYSVIHHFLYLTDKEYRYRCELECYADELKILAKQYGNNHSLIKNKAQLFSSNIKHRYNNCTHLSEVEITKNLLSSI